MPRASRQGLPSTSPTRQGAALALALAILFALLVLGLPVLVSQSADLAGTRAFADRLAIEHERRNAEALALALAAEAMAEGLRPAADGDPANAHMLKTPGGASDLHKNLLDLPRRLGQRTDDGVYDRLLHPVSAALSGTVDEPTLWWSTPKAPPVPDPADDPDAVVDPDQAIAAGHSQGTAVIDATRLLATLQDDDVDDGAVTSLPRHRSTIELQDLGGLPDVNDLHPGLWEGLWRNLLYDERLFEDLPDFDVDPNDEHYGSYLAIITDWDDGSAFDSYEKRQDEDGRWYDSDDGLSYPFGELAEQIFAYRYEAKSVLPFQRYLTLPDLFSHTDTGHWRDNQLIDDIDEDDVTLNVISSEEFGTKDDVDAAYRNGRLERRFGLRLPFTDAEQAQLTEHLRVASTAQGRSGMLDLGTVIGHALQVSEDGDDPGRYRNTFSAVYDADLQEFVAGYSQVISVDSNRTRGDGAESWNPTLPPRHAWFVDSGSDATNPLEEDDRHSRWPGRLPTWIGAWYRPAAGDGNEIVFGDNVPAPGSWIGLRLPSPVNVNTAPDPVLRMLLGLDHDKPLPVRPIHSLSALWNIYALQREEWNGSPLSSFAEHRLGGETRRLERPPLDVRSYGIASIAVRAEGHDLRGHVLGVSRSADVYQVLPPLAPHPTAPTSLRRSWTSQADFEQIVGWRHGSQVASWPKPLHRSSEINTIELAAGDGDAGLRSSPLDNWASVAEDPMNDWRRRWRLPFGATEGSGAGGSLEPVVDSATGGSQRQGATEQALLRPDGVVIEAADGLRYQLSSSSGVDSMLSFADNRLPDELQPFYLDFWIQPQEDLPLGNKTPLLRAGNANREFTDSKSSWGLYFHSRDGDRCFLVLEYSNAAQSAAPSDAHVDLLSLMNGPAIGEKEDLLVDWASFGDALPESLLDLSTKAKGQAISEDGDKPQIFKATTSFPDYVNRFRHVYKLPGTLRQGQWYHIQVVWHAARPGQSILIVDGLVGRHGDFGPLAPRGGDWLPGDQMTFPQFHLEEGLPGPEVEIVLSEELVLEDGLALSVPAFAEHYFGQAFTAAEVLPQRGTVLVGDEHIAYAGIDGNRLLHCRRGARTNTDQYPGDGMTGEDFEAIYNHEGFPDIRPLAIDIDFAPVDDDEERANEPWQNRIALPSGPNVTVGSGNLLFGQAKLLGEQLPGTDETVSYTVLDWEADDTPLTQDSVSIQASAADLSRLPGYDQLLEAQRTGGASYVKHNALFKLEKDTYSRRYGVYRILRFANPAIPGGPVVLDAVTWLESKEPFALADSGIPKRGADELPLAHTVDLSDGSASLMVIGVQVENTGDIALHEVDAFYQSQAGAEDKGLLQVEATDGQIEWIAYDFGATLELEAFVADIPANDGSGTTLTVQLDEETQSYFVDHEGFKPDDTRAQQRTARIPTGLVADGARILPVQMKVEGGYALLSGDRIAIIPKADPRNAILRQVRYAADDGFLVHWPTDAAHDVKDEYFAFTDPINAALRGSATALVGWPGWNGEDLTPDGTILLPSKETYTTDLQEGSAYHAALSVDLATLGKDGPTYVHFAPAESGRVDLAFDGVVRGEPAATKAFDSLVPLPAAEFGIDYVIEGGDSPVHSGLPAEGLALLGGRVVSYINVVEDDVEHLRLTGQGLLGSAGAGVDFDLLALNPVELFPLPIGPVAHLETALPGSSGEDVELDEAFGKPIPFIRPSKIDTQTSPPTVETITETERWPNHVLMLSEDGTRREIASLRTRSQLHLHPAQEAGAGEKRLLAWTAPWLRGLFGTGIEPFAAGSVVIGWQPRFAPHANPPRLTDNKHRWVARASDVTDEDGSVDFDRAMYDWRSAQLRSRAYQWTSFPLRWQDCFIDNVEFNVGIPRDGNGNPLLDLKLRLLGNSIGGDPAGGAAERNPAMAWSQALLAEPSYDPNVAGQQDIDGYRFQDGVEMKVYFTYKNEIEPGGGSLSDAVFFPRLASFANQSAIISRVSMDFRAATKRYDQQAATVSPNVAQEGE